MFLGDGITNKVGRKSTKTNIDKKTNRKTILCVLHNTTKFAKRIFFFYHIKFFSVLNIELIYGSYDGGGIQKCVI